MISTHAHMHMPHTLSFPGALSAYGWACMRMCRGCLWQQVGELRNRVHGLRHSVASEYEATTSRLTTELDQVSGRVRSLVGATQSHRVHLTTTAAASTPPQPPPPPTLQCP